MHEVKVVRIGSIEKSLYGIFFLLNVLYGLYSLYNESSKYKRKYHEKSWLISGLTRDLSDREWVFSTEILLERKEIIFLLLTIVVDYVAKNFIPRFHKWIILIYSFGLMTKMFTIYAFALLLATVIVMYFVTALFKSKILVWVLSILFTLSFETEKIATKLYHTLANADLEYVYMYMFNISMFFGVLRIISFSLEKVDELNRSKEIIGDSKKRDDPTIQPKNEDHTLFNFLLYVFYPSFLFVSPFIPFKNFYLSFTEKRLNVDVKQTFLLFLRILFAFVLMEVVLHFTLTYAIHKNINLLDSLSKYTLVMSLYLKGSLFSTKYVFLYGVPTFVNQLVGMKTTPLPRCISVIHTNGEMWKYFDTGIYEFIKNCLYIPLGGNRISKPRQMLSLLISFGYLSYWHGHSFEVTLWSVFNLTMIICELIFFSYLVYNQTIISLISRFSELNKRRIICAILALWQMILYIIAFLFLSNAETTQAIYKKVLLDNFPTSFILFFASYYCNAQMRMDLMPFKY